jgi:Flp pilus assembly protein TadG
MRVHPFARSGRLLPSSLPRRFARATGGVAAVEFALILPVMLVMYLGLVAVTVGVNTNRKVTLVSRTVSDLVARSTSSLRTAELDTLVRAAATVIAPYNPAGLNVALASVVVRRVGGSDAAPVLEARVCWSVAKELTSTGELASGTLPPGWSPNTVISPIPDGFRNPGSSFIMSTVKKPYTPVVGASITGNITLEESTPWPTRNVTEIALEGTPACLT